MLNSVELLVDLMRFPGQLIPFSTKAIFISHIPAAGESDSAENDSCDSPLEPNSPLCGFSDRMDGEGYESHVPFVLIFSFPSFLFYSCFIDNCEIIDPQCIFYIK